MFYTIVPEDQLLEGWEDAVPVSFDVPFHSGLMEVEPIDMFSGKIVRIISSNPQDYLDPQYQPGSLFNWRENVSDV